MLSKKIEPLVRLTRPGDINTVTTIDLKCFHYPLTMKEWQEHLSGSGQTGKARIVLVEVNRQPVGFAMWSIDSDNIGQLHRLGVLPEYRRLRLGTVLMAACIKYCAEQLCDKIRCTVPALHCNPGDPDDVAAYLLACGFKTTGEIVDNFARMYGDLIEGYTFERGTYDIGGY